MTITPGDAEQARRAEEFSSTVPLPAFPGESGGPSPRVIQVPPALCNYYPDGVWSVLSRTSACSLTPWTLTVTTTANGATTVTGEMEFFLRYYTYTSPSGATWAHQIELITELVWGDAVGTVVTGAASCNLMPGSLGGACGTASSSFTPATLAVTGQIASGEAFQTFTGTGPSNGAGAWTLSLKAPKAPAPATARGYSLDVRCDAVLPGYSAGCVFDQWTPHLVFSSLANPAFRQHVLAAQASGLPGSPSTGELHRTQDSNLNNLNGITACPSVSSAPWLTRPTGYSCDEYPFRSTYEGAAAGGTARTYSGCQIALPNPSSTGPIGFSICMIPVTQNSSAGGILNSLYNANRVIEGDAFWVEFD